MNTCGYLPRRRLWRRRDVVVAPPFASPQPLPQRWRRYLRCAAALDAWRTIPGSPPPPPPPHHDVSLPPRLTGIMKRTICSFPFRLRRPVTRWRIGVRSVFVAIKQVRGRSAPPAYPVVGYCRCWIFIVFYYILPFPACCVDIDILDACVLLLPQRPLLCVDQP